MVIISKEENITKMKSALDTIEKSTTPVIKSDFGQWWFGCFVHLIGGNPEKTDCRGTITDYSLTEKTLYLEVLLAWTEPIHTMQFIKEKFPGTIIYFQAEEIGCNHYVTNDRKGTYFPERYFIEGESICQEYFKTLPEAIRYLNENAEGFRCEENASYEKVESATKTYSKEKTIHLGIHEFKII